MPSETMINKPKKSIRVSVNRFFSRYLGKTAFYTFLLGVSEFSIFSWNIIRSSRKMTFSHMDAFLRVVINQIKFTGAKALPLLSIISLTLGASTIIQAVTFLPKFGQDDFIGNLLKLVIVREVGPLITAIVVLTRSGSAIASEMATQKLHREIEAIELMGINPNLLMIMPRIIAGIVSVSLLIVYFDFVAFLGGYMIANMVSSFPFSTFLEHLLKSLAITDILSSQIKALVCGITIPLVCSYYGLKPNTLFEIPIFVSKAVVRSLFSVFLLTGLISVVFYL
ncbi:MAG: ABC transporter permease [Spirochaetia bacterium]|nr:ABC transporter permease [Spirochaetia bacterium]